jgi:dihydroflavonol-4-reductase
MNTVLVTGGSGFIAGHCILQLLAAGYTVRATLRSLDREHEVRARLRAAGAAANAPLTFVTANLSSDEGWGEAARDCRYVLHVASPLLNHVPRNEDELIVPAREGTLRVLRAARDAHVRRVVLTSSFAAIGYGHPPGQKLDETTWTNLNARVAAYPKSKTLAEWAAWEFIAREGGSLELAVVNPVAVFGPALDADISPSLEIIQRMLDGRIPALPKLHFGVVDVRDVADLHLRAMTSEAAAGERFLAVAGPAMSLLQIAQVLRVHLGTAARRAPRREIPDWIVRALAVCGLRVARMAAPELGKIKHVSNDKARRLLGWQPRSNEDSILASAESLLRLGLIRK